MKIVKLSLGVCLMFMAPPMHALVVDFSGLVDINDRGQKQSDVPFFGSIDFDLNTPVLPDSESVIYKVPIGSLNLLAAGNTFGSLEPESRFDTTVYDGDTMDYLAMTPGAIRRNDAGAGEFTLWFMGGDGSVFTDSSLDNVRRMGMLPDNVIDYDGYTDGFSMHGHVMSVVPQEKLVLRSSGDTDAPVPEPAPLALLGGGLVCVVPLRRFWRTA